MPFFATLALALCAVSSVSAADLQAVSLENLKPHNVRIEKATYKGRESVRVSATPSETLDDGTRFASIPNTIFQDGTIELDLAGDVLPGYDESFRGFTGVAFRLDPDITRYECFYLRTRNGRSADQLQRNHSIQYISYPEFPWQKLRKETPGKYESYVDLVPGEWTHVRVTVIGQHAELFVNNAEQPTLIVNDLKHGDSTGALALWIGPGTDAYFNNLKATLTSK